MDAKKIRGLLLSNGFTLTDVAAQLGVSRQAVCMVINGYYTGTRIRQWIAKKLNSKEEEIWPSKTA